MANEKQDEQSAVDKLNGMKFKSAMRSLNDLEPDQIEDIILEGETKLASMDTDEKGQLIHISKLTKSIQKAYDEFGKVSGISTGLPSIDSRIGGMRSGQLILVGGESNMGKSALVANIAVNVSRQHPVVYITLEMLPEENGARIMHMNNGSLEGLDIHFQQTFDIDYRHLKPLFESAIKVGARLVILDYLQYLGRGMDNTEVAKMTKVMKALTLEYRLPFLVVVSLKKDQFKNRSIKNIELDELMGTSAIGYDADVALAVSKRDVEGNYQESKLFVKVLKVRAVRKDPEVFTLSWNSTAITEYVEPAIQAYHEPDKEEDKIDLEEAIKLFG